MSRGDEEKREPDQKGDEERAGARDEEALKAAERLEAEDRDTARLVERAQAGERELLGTLYTRYFDRVLGYVNLVIHDEHEAEDLTQQTFVRVIEKIDTYERRRQPFRAWLFAIARNNALMHLRKQGRVEPMDPAELDRELERRQVEGREPGPLDVLTWITSRELLMFVERLPLAQRQALVLRHLLDMSSAEAAEVLGTTPGAVRALQSRAAKTLRERLEAIGEAPNPDKRSMMRAGVRQSRVLRNRRFAL